jgi:hypothetical protein
MTVVVPDDLKAFLSAGKQLQYDPRGCEPGLIKLLPLDKLVLGEVRVAALAAAAEQGDPHAWQRGYYVIPAVNLVAEADGYDPEFILLWLPEDDAYGTWDNEHYELLVFPGVTWSEIAANPLPYIGAQWDGPEPGIPFAPHPKYPFQQETRH